eukprot:TRINITY_DN17329_c0_g5_i1.p1 TRINITY_DN17329_c0_g5~~TRINITY_DN17329_c0_g5_i1.p1  ORF type:complete len:795 (-),score=101.19 TRINITY_DN17329_c0_g5_i1:169-2553(-)
MVCCRLVGTWPATSSKRVDLLGQRARSMKRPCIPDTILEANEDCDDAEEDYEIESNTIQVPRDEAGLVAPWKVRSKDSLARWNQYQTVSWRLDAHKEDSLHAQTASFLGRRCHQLVTWCLPAVIGVLTACSGAFIERGCLFLSDLRFGICMGKPFVGRGMCPAGGWVALDEALGVAPFIVYFAMAGLLALVASSVTKLLAPAANGSGIPEVKTILGGFMMPDVLEPTTLAAKIVGLMFACSSGLSLGKEGPLVHVGCCWARLLSRLSPRLASNEARQLEMISCGAAAGVAVAFGAPVGGVLFSYEEASTVFPRATMVRCFLASFSAVLALQYLDPDQLGTKSKTMFEVHYSRPPSWLEYMPYLVLAVIGGMIGAVFVRCNVLINERRAPGSAFRRAVPVVVEVVALALATAAMDFWLPITRPLMTPVIRALFQQCPGTEGADMFGLCDEEGSQVLAALLAPLLCAAAMRLLQMTVTFGTGVPAGLFVPSLFIGASLGRAFGLGMIRLQEHDWFLVGDSTIRPGMFAMVGAAAVLGGACRVTISLTAIMVELTGELQLVPAFMLVLLISKIVGDQFSEGIYDACVRIRGYPFLHDLEDCDYSATRAGDLLDGELDCLTLEDSDLNNVLKMASESQHRGFPLIRSREDPEIIGFVDAGRLRDRLRWALREQSCANAQSSVAFRSSPCSRHDGSRATVDVSDLVDETVVRVVPETPAADVHKMFQMIGVERVLVTQAGRLQGMITKKALINYLSSRPNTHQGDEHPSSKGSAFLQPTVLRCGNSSRRSLDQPLLHAV